MFGNGHNGATGERRHERHDAGPTGAIHITPAVIVIAVPFAALCWNWSAHNDIMRRPVKKTLCIAAFACATGDCSNLARIVCARRARRSRVDCKGFDSVRTRPPQAHISAVAGSYADSIGRYIAPRCPTRPMPKPSESCRG